MYGASLVAQLVKNPPVIQETWVRSLSWEGALEKGKDTHLFWPGEFHELYSSQGRKESDMTERLSLSTYMTEAKHLKVILDFSLSTHNPSVSLFGVSYPQSLVIHSQKPSTSQQIHCKGTSPSHNQTTSPPPTPAWRVCSLQPALHPANTLPSQSINGIPPV